MAALAGAILFGVTGTMVAPGRPLAATAASSEIRTSTILGEVSKAWFKGEWAAYRATFISDDGRVIDNANGGVSHSEGQGYGLLLAVEADDAATFATLWRWTVDHLRKRPDALFAWKWDPQRQRVADLNNASDGDILIAWALVKAAKKFGREAYMAEARSIMKAVAADLLKPGRTGTVLLPAARGFGAADQPDGPVVNPSYWVYPAFRDLAPLVPGVDWEGLRRTGLKLLDASRFGASRLPTNWVALGGSAPAPARNFPAEFGYDAIRIPLYLAADPDGQRDALARFAGPAFPSSGSSGPAVIEVSTGSVRQPMQGAGYRMVVALARCAARSESIPPDLMSSRDDLYYPETLRLLSISIVQERFPRCL